MPYGIAANPDKDKRKKRRIYVTDAEYRLILKALSFTNPDVAVSDIPTGDKVSIFCVASAKAIIAESE